MASLHKWCTKSLKRWEIYCSEVPLFLWQRCFISLMIHDRISRRKSNKGNRTAPRRTKLFFRINWPFVTHDLTHIWRTMMALSSHGDVRSLKFILLSVLNRNLWGAILRSCSIEMELNRWQVLAWVHDCIRSKVFWSQIRNSYCGLT